MGMVEWQPPELPAGVADRIADAVAIPITQRAHFAATLAGLIALARGNHEWDIQASSNRDIADIQLGELRGLLASLAKRIDTLTPSTRRHLGLYALHQRQRGDAVVDEPIADLRLTLADMVEAGGMERGEEIVAEYQRSIAEMLAAASLREWPKSAGGRPRKRPGGVEAGDPAVSANDLLVIELVVTIRDHGGKPTLDKNAGTGRLIDALRIARPHLPHGLIPAGIMEPDADGKLSGLSKLAHLRQQALRRQSRTGQEPPRK